METKTYNASMVINKWTHFLGTLMMVASLGSTVIAGGPTTVNLGTAADFRVLSKTGITTTGVTSIIGDIGISPGVSGDITGFGLAMDGLGSGTFSTSTLVTGKIYASDYAIPTPAKCSLAVADMEAAYTDAATRPTPDYTNVGTAGDITGQNLTPGLYKWTTGVSVAAAGVTLSGTASDIWIFQISGALGLANGASVTLSGGALASNIFWQVAGQVTLGTTAVMKGIILGQTAIVYNNGATLDGRALAQAEVTFIGNTVLPVEMVAFTAAANRLNADLQWSTATEVNSYGFEIERRQTENWEKVGFVTGAGTSNAPHDYTYSDNSLSPGRYVYRIKQIDNNGTFAYYGSAEVEVGITEKKFSLESNYPNPFNPSTTIQFMLGSDGMTSLQVYNILGQKVMTLFEGSAQAGKMYQVKFEASNLPSGLYFAKLESGKQHMLRKMLLMK